MKRAQGEAVYLRGYLSTAPKPARDAIEKIIGLLSVEYPDPPRADLLHPAERIALTVAGAQVRRGDEVPPNTTAMLVVALERLRDEAAPTPDPQGDERRWCEGCGYEVLMPVPAQCPRCGNPTYTARPPTQGKETPAQDECRCPPSFKKHEAHLSSCQSSRRQT